MDAPDVLAFKRRVIVERGFTPECVRCEIPVDLRGEWTTPLLRAGFRKHEPTVWLMEGLLMYLGAESIECIFEDIATMSVRGSRLSAEFAHPNLLSRFARLKSTIDMTERTGVVWQWGTETPAAWLARRGWHATIADGNELARSYGREAPHVLNPSDGDERLWLLHATRTSIHGDSQL
ncbi:SAM-dependent methyltransferase [Pendulispora brunnea]|uniref:S-adenosyl-L-methionine-dependent methyltransferase n=1 Tax=Pendulispora brunnea TaxID=2905690 RepID=A0ABZ2KJ16_9BACT